VFIHLDLAPFFYRTFPGRFYMFSLCVVSEVVFWEAASARRRCLLSSITPGASAWIVCVRLSQSLSMATQCASNRRCHPLNKSNGYTYSYSKLRTLACIFCHAYRQD